MSWNSYLILRADIVDLPFDVLVDRVRNELELCDGYVQAAPDLSDPDRVSFPVTVDIGLTRVPAHFVEGGKRVVRYSHRFRVRIPRDYPYEKPTVTWLTPIFHPNIMMPEDGGYLCTKLLEGWDFDSNVSMFIKGVEALISSPNPASPFGTDSCTAAAEYYNRSSSHLPPMINVPPPRVVSHK